MASIQQSVNSAFNALLVAGLGGSRVIGQSQAVQKHKQSQALAKELEGAYTQLDEITYQYATEAEEGLDKGEINKAQDEINKAGLHTEELLRRMVQLNPTPSTVAQLHELSTQQGSIAIEKQKQLIEQKRQQKSTLEERKKIGGAN